MIVSIVKWQILRFKNWTNIKTNLWVCYKIVAESMMSFNKVQIRTWEED